MTTSGLELRPPAAYTFRPENRDGWWRGRWQVWLDGVCLGTVTAAQARAALVGRLHPAALVMAIDGRAAKLGLEAQNTAAEIKLRAERKAGELLAELERGKENQHTKSAMSNVGHGTSEYRQALEESATSYQEASRFQATTAARIDGGEYDH